MGTCNMVGSFPGSPEIFTVIGGLSSTKLKNFTQILSNFSKEV